MRFALPLAVTLALAVAAAAQTPAPPPATQPAAPASAPAATPAAAAPDAPAAAEHHEHKGNEYDAKLPGDAPIFKTTKLKIAHPVENSVLVGTDVDVEFSLAGYRVSDGPPAPGAKAPHIHVILDNEPYKPDYDATKPFKLTGLSGGAHVIRAFPSRPWHESIKAPNAFAMVRFYSGEKAATQGKWPDPKKPLLTYSRPKGEYAGDDAKRIMVDFYLTNAKLSPKGYRVRLAVDGKEWPLITEWKPLWLEGLAPGEHKLVLELLDKKGNAVENVFNRTERTITVK